MSIQASFKSCWKPEYTKGLRHMTSFTMGVSFAALSTSDLYLNQAGTLAQITLIALPILHVLSHLICTSRPPLQRQKILKLEAVPFAYMLGVLMVILHNCNQLSQKQNEYIPRIKQNLYYRFFSTCNEWIPTLNLIVTITAVIFASAVAQQRHR
jgi:hypothetical protein